MLIKYLPFVIGSLYNLYWSFPSGCNLTVSADSGVIHSPLYNQTAGNLNCTYVLSLPAKPNSNSRVAITFNKLDLGKGKLDIYDGNSTKQPLVAGYTGKNLSFFLSQQKILFHITNVTEWEVLTNDKSFATTTHLVVRRKARQHPCTKYITLLNDNHVNPKRKNKQIELEMIEHKTCKMHASFFYKQ